MPKEYTDVQKRDALSAAYQILSDTRNRSRYANTLFGVSMDHYDHDEGLSLYDVLTCLSLMHRDMITIKEGTPDA